MYEVSEKQQEPIALETTVFEQFYRDTVCSPSLVIGRAKIEPGRLLPERKPR
jgi:hypothetical protein